MAEKFKKQLSKLSKRGPHHVLIGDLSYAGLPGKVYTPAEGNGVAAIAFGHDWMTSVKSYHQTLQHLGHCRCCPRHGDGIHAQPPGPRC